MVEIYYIITGLFVGVTVGMTGIGGGSLMTPILVLGFGLPSSVAVGTDLLYASLTKVTGVWVYSRKGVVHWKVVGLLLAGSIPGSLSVILLLRQVFSGTAMDSIINPTLGIALTLTSLALLLKQQLKRLFQQHRHGWIGAGVVRYRDSVTILVGFLLGILVTLSSIGAGALGTVFLVALYPSLPIVAIVATELAHAVVLAAVAGAGHWHLGTVNLTLLTFLLIGSIPGAYIGSHVGVRLPECYVRPILASMLLFVGLRFTL